jgi:N-acetylneuraminic acid mutarotase
VTHAFSFRVFQAGNGMKRSALMAMLLLATLGLALLGFATAAPRRAPIAEGQGTWTVKSPMPGGPRAEIPAVAVNGKIYVVGGSAKGISYNITRNEEYDPTTDRWRLRAPMPNGLNHSGTTALDGKLYAAGGFTNPGHHDPSDSFFSYDPSTDTWRTLAPLPSRRGAVAVAALDGKIHVLGGREGESAPITAHDVYDPASGKWSTAAPLTRARDHMAAVAIDGRIHLIGGRQSVDNDGMVDWHEVYDPATNSWSSAPPLPEPRGGVVGALYEGLIVILGAEDNRRTYDENFAFEVETNRWIRLKPLPQPMHGFGAAAAGQYLYVAGGARVVGSSDVSDQLLAFGLPQALPAGIQAR